MRKLTITAAILLTAVFLGCGDGDKKVQSTPQQKQEKAIQKRAEALQPYTPHNNVEFNNFNRAQKLYDDPNTIQWCTTTWPNPSAPMVTFPVAGKLTSSSVSYRPQQTVIRAEMPGDGLGLIPFALGEAVSSDGMHHGNPPGYRYGFTPGGIYNDVFEMPTFCTTALTKFQREQTAVSVTIDQEANDLTKQAEEALKNKDPKRAQQILDSLESK